MGGRGAGGENPGVKGWEVSLREAREERAKSRHSRGGV